MRTDLGRKWTVPSDMSKFYVYALCKPDGTPFYIGKGKGYRINHHFKTRELSLNTHKNNIIRKYGIPNIKCEIIAYFDTELSAYVHEEFLITHYGRYHDGGLLSNNCKSHWDTPPILHAKPCRQEVAKKLTRLSLPQAESLLSDYATGGYTQKELAIKYGIGSTTVGRLLAGEIETFSSLKIDFVKRDVYRITHETVNAIREDKSRELPIKSILEKYKISRTHLYRILRGDSLYLQDTSTANREN